MQITTSCIRRWALALACSGIAGVLVAGSTIGCAGASTDATATTQPTTAPATRPATQSASVADVQAVSNPQAVVDAETHSDAHAETHAEQPPVPSEVNLEQIRQDVEWLAAAERGGRMTGTPGIEASADYIVERFTELGLESPGDLEGFRQTWSLNTGSRLIEDSTNLSFNGQQLTLGDDYNPMGWSTPADFEGELAFAGYAIDDPDENMNDLEGVDLEGKVALVLRYEPRDEDGLSLLTRTRGVSGNSSFAAKLGNLVEAGAKAVLIVNPPLNGAEEDRIPGFTGTRQFGEIPAMFVTQDVAGRMLTAAGLPDLASMQISADAKLVPAAQPATQPATQPSTQPSTQPATQPGDAAQPVIVAGGFESEPIGTMATNVVGVLPGKNTDEYIVIGAHYDHIGMGEFGSREGPGEIHNGADDNASGTAAVLAIAEMFAEGPQPECSIMFVLFSAEEIGLVGSRHIVQPENSPVPVEQLKAMINLDMVGRLRENNLSVGGMQNAAPFPSVVETANTEALGLNIQRMSAQFDGRSDHASYNNAGIPAMFFFTGLHDDYHTPRDDVELINFNGIGRVAALAHASAEQLTEMPTFDLAFTGPARRVRLGVTPDVDASAEAAGVVLSSVAPDTPAAGAGMQAGDVLTSLGGEAITGLEDLRSALSNQRRGEKTEAVVVRGGESKTLEVSF